MIRALATFLLFALLSAGCIAFAWVSTLRLAPEAERSRSLRWLVPWSLKGLVVPAAIWFVMNLGLSFELQPFVPQIQAARSGGRSWIPLFCQFFALGLFVISSYWAAVTLGWVLGRVPAGLQGQVRSDFRSLCLASGFGMLLPAAGIFWLGGSAMLGLALLAMLTPIAGYAPVVLHPKKGPPMYARAIARIKFGKYAEAEWEIIRELEKWEDDFEGWMMLAELYATRFNDLPEAEQTILEICDHPRTTPSQTGVALHRLADWYLNLRDDPDAARRALQVLCDRFAGTHLARMAAARITQLPRTPEELRERRQDRPVPLPPLSEDLDEMAKKSASAPGGAEAAELASQLAERLKHEPDNVLVRERLARVYAENLGQANLAVAQVELLLGRADQPEEKQAHWLSLIAAWQFRLLHAPEIARRTMQRLIRDYPHSAQAFAAQRRLNLMDAEAREQQAKAAVAKLRLSPGQSK